MIHEKERRIKINKCDKEKTFEQAGKRRGAFS
jgi:hypothetical protein